MFKFFHKFDLIIGKIAQHLLVLSILSMLGISVLSIILRWFNTNILWFEPLIRYLVFLSAFLGGTIATGRRTHIGIDLVGKFFESRKKWEAQRWVGRMTDLVSFLVLLVLIKACLDFVGEEAKYGRTNVFLHIHAKYLAAIIPFGFGLIALRFFNNIILSFSKEYQLKPESEVKILSKRGGEK